VEDKDDLGILRVVYLFFDDLVADPHVCGGIAPVPLDQALHNVEDDARPEGGKYKLLRVRSRQGGSRLVVDAEDRPLEGDGQAVETVLHPV
jgi:hypothetical protein